MPSEFKEKQFTELSRQVRMSWANKKRSLIYHWRVPKGGGK